MNKEKRKTKERKREKENIETLMQAEGRKGGGSKLFCLLVYWRAYWEQQKRAAEQPFSDTSVQPCPEIARNKEIDNDSPSRS